MLLRHSCAIFATSEASREAFDRSRVTHCSELGTYLLYAQVNNVIASTLIPIHHSYYNVF